MIDSLKINDKVKFKDSRICTVYKVCKAKKLDSFIYGLGLDPIHPGNFEWYYENGKPVTYWINTPHSRQVNENKTVIEIVRN